MPSIVLSGLVRPGGRPRPARLGAEATSERNGLEAGRPGAARCTRRAAAGISPGTVRLSIGVEDVDDIWADIAQASERVDG